jgi:hypothetical protein
MTYRKKMNWGKKQDHERHESTAKDTKKAGKENGCS